MNHFLKLPEACLSAILSLTTPADAARSSAVSKGFKLAAQSDVIWERFLHQELIISRSTSLPICSTKKELFITLSYHSLILLDEATLSHSLDRWSGKKCFMVAPKALSIVFVDNRRHWEWTTHPYSRFLEVVILKCTHWLDIRGKIGTRMLSPGTNYAAYLVFKLLNDTVGIKTLNAMIRIVNHESENEAARRATTVYIPSMSRFFVKNKTDPLYEKYAKIRGDGWMEVQLGEFYNKEGVDNGEVEARCMEIERLHVKSGLVVEGIEFRPNPETK